MRPSNILIRGKTGTGKTVVVRYVGTELENAVASTGTSRVVHLNCEVIDTQYSRPGTDLKESFW